MLVYLTKTRWRRYKYSRAMSWTNKDFEGAVLSLAGGKRLQQVIPSLKAYFVVYCLTMYHEPWKHLQLFGMKIFSLWDAGVHKVVQNEVYASNLKKPDGWMNKTLHFLGSRVFGAIDPVLKGFSGPSSQWRYPLSLHMQVYIPLSSIKIPFSPCKQLNT